MTYTKPPCLQHSNTSRRSWRGKRGDIHTTTLPTRLKHKSPVRGWRTTHDHATYMTRTQVTDEVGRKGCYKDNCPAYKTQAQFADQGGGDIHTTALPARLKHKSPIREGVIYTQLFCLQDLNTRRRSGRGERGDIHTTTLPTRLKNKSPVRGWRTTHNHATYKTRTQVTDEGGRRG